MKPNTSRPAHSQALNSQLRISAKALDGTGACCYLCGMTTWTPPQAVNLVDLGFMDSRSKLIDLAAFLDRVQRAGQEDDFRVKALKSAITLLQSGDPERAKQALLSFSDLSTDPIPKATTQGAIGAYPASSI
jgi:hypothetical protein